MAACRNLGCMFFSEPEGLIGKISNGRKQMVNLPAPVAYLPFGGMKASQWADIKTQGKAVVKFFTQDKVITERYWTE
jgi:acyl-CoA reductase-like NAD-dependent aldehyde dehydrogenase